MPLCPQSEIRNVRIRAERSDVANCNQCGRTGRGRPAIACKAGRCAPIDTQVSRNCQINATVSPVKAPENKKAGEDTSSFAVAGNECLRCISKGETPLPRLPKDYYCKDHRNAIDAANLRQRGK